MPSAKGSTAATTKQSPKVPTKPAEGAEVLTLTETAAYLRVAESEVLRMIREQRLAARQFGSDGRFLKAAVEDWLRTGPFVQGYNDSLMSLAGAWKDDPYLDDLLKEIYKNRGRPMTEDGE
jgi:excisionase family DNA binding protein